MVAITLSIINDAVVIRSLVSLLSLGFLISSLGFSAQRPNIIVILADDNRYDFLSCHPEASDSPETPNLDRMAAQGTHLKNAFVTTSLCCSSRASILTGQYMRHHRVVDNQRAVPSVTPFLPHVFRPTRVSATFPPKANS